MLGVGRDDSELAIRAAYRRLVVKHHPDRHPGDPGAAVRLRNLVEAYEVLGEPEARRRYDEGHRPPQPSSAAPLEELLGRVVDAFVDVKDARGRAGRDHQYRLTLDFAEAARGGTKTLDLPLWRTCTSCEGRGFPLEVLPQVCGACEGAGAIEKRRSLRRVIESCEACEGRGYAITTPCSLCAGGGALEERRELKIDVPAGVTNASRLVVRGAGQAGKGGAADGDCYVLISVTPHPVLERSGDDIVMSRPVSFLRALCGGWVSVPTVDGVRQLRLPAKSEDRSVLRMVGLGIGSDEASRGDQLVTLEIEYPDMMSDALVETLVRLEAQAGEEVFPLTRRFEACYGSYDGELACPED